MKLSSAHQNKQIKGLRLTGLAKAILTLQNKFLHFHSLAYIITYMSVDCVSMV